MTQIDKDAALAMIERKVGRDNPALADELRHAIRALPAVTPKVEALVWEPWENGNSISKETILGVYCVWDGYYRPPNHFGGIRAKDPKAAAQADYEARILSALITEELKSVDIHSESV
jgi:hypothetical protein